MLRDWISWLLAIGIAVGLVLLVVDAFFVEIPRVRRYRGLVGGLIVFAGGVMVGREVSGNGEDDPNRPSDSPVSPEPETFDDEPERQADAEADDLDLDTAAADRELDDLSDSNAGNRADLDDLLLEIEEGGEDRPGGSG